MDLAPVYGITSQTINHGSRLAKGTVNYKYVDETADIARQYLVDLSFGYSTNASSHLASETRRPVASPWQPDPTEPSMLSDTGRPHSSNQPLLPHEPSSSLAGHSPYALQLPENQSSLSSASTGFSHSNYSSPGSRDLITVESGFPSLDEYEACLMRYFVLQLAPWFDICDGERHFACTVPLRARTCPPLLNAIYTASARHLSRVKRYYYGNQVHYGGKVLPNLTPETAIRYHNECIAHFMSLSEHSRETQNENLLAAAVILRFYEEVDSKNQAATKLLSSLTLTVQYMGEDIENALRGIQIFLDAQAMSAVAGYGLRHAAYWIALRQEIITAFSKQRSFRLPLGPCEPYRSFEPADDYVWADRLVIHCAHVLQYCFGSEEENPSSDRQLWSIDGLHSLTATDLRIARYDELVAFEAHWAELGPPSFKPIYAREPDRSRGEVFPELWYLNNCHVAGLQFLELARILLAVYNPKLARLGPHQRTGMRSVDLKVREILIRLCGIALSNQHSPPSLVTASVAIGMCGDRFTDRLEQEALLSVLVRLEDEHAYPTNNTQELLKEAWEWNVSDVSS
ncbi:hypothetical protein N7510_002373 [Penicillium lagena]|uniref:uncharacterized protein n=1 Tax=Penicillium lagena TaxID=94218 RepID=UPI0025402977|nr:uncharacterized protein N7510_002373 [Penicillium lagena]KAJ5626064.1 hypothetical protein N7510_002373 [Penicillium lagena]